MTNIVLPTPVLKSDTFEIWRRKTNQAISSMTQIVSELESSAYLDDQFRIGVIEGKKIGFISGKVRNRSEIYEVNPLTTVDLYNNVAGGPIYPLVVSADLMAEDVITVVNLTTTQTLPDTSYTVNYATNTITVIDDVSDTDDVEITVAQKYIVLDFSAAADGVHNVYVDCSGIPFIDIGAVPDSPFPTTPVIPLYRIETSGNPNVAITQNTDYPEDLRTWATVAVDPSIIATGKLEYREVLVAPASSVVSTFATLVYSDTISVYINGIRQSKEGVPPDYTIVDNGGFIEIDFGANVYPTGTDILVVASEDDHNISVAPLYSLHTVTTPAQTAFVVNPTTEFVMVDNDPSVAVYIGGVRQIPSVAVYTIDGTTNTVTLSVGVTNTTVMIIKNENAGSSISSLPGGVADDLLTRTVVGAEWKPPEFDASAIVSGTIDAARIPFATIQECIDGVRTDVLVDPRGYFLAKAKDSLNKWNEHEVGNNSDFTIVGSTTFPSSVDSNHYIALKHGAVIRAPYYLNNFRDGRLKNTPFTKLTSITVDPMFHTASGITDDQFLLVSNEDGKIAYLSHRAIQKQTEPDDWNDENVYNDWVEIDNPATNGTLTPISGQNWKCVQVEAVALAGGVAINSTDGLVSNTNININDNPVRYIIENGFDVNAKINAIVKDSAGDYYFAGKFNYAGGIRANNIVKYTPSSNKFTPLGTTVIGGGIACTSTQEVLCMHIFDDGVNEYLYAGGSFDSAGNNAANSVANTDWIARWNIDTNTWSSVGTFNGAVGCFEDDGTLVYAGGSFTSANSVAGTQYIAQWDGSVWADVATGSANLNGIVRTTRYVPTFGLFIAGEFTSPVNGYLALLSGVSWVNPTGGAEYVNNHIYCLDYGDVGGDTYLFLGGRFTTANGVPARTLNHAAKINLSSVDKEIVPIDAAVISGFPFSTATPSYKFDPTASGTTTVEYVKFINGYLYMGGLMKDMNKLTSSYKKWNERLGGLVRYDLGVEWHYDPSYPSVPNEFLLTNNVQPNTEYTVPGLTNDTKKIVCLFNRDRHGILEEETDYTVDYETGKVTFNGVTASATRVRTGDDIFFNIGFESLAGHGIFDNATSSTTDNKRVGCLYEEGGQLLIGSYAGGGILRFNPAPDKPKDRFTKILSGHPIYYYALFEKPDGSEWRIYRTTKGNIISASNGYLDGFNPTNPSEIEWQLVDTITTTEHWVTPQIKAHTINPNTIKGTLIGWFVGKQFRFHRTPDTANFTDDWDLINLQFVDLNTTSTDIPADHCVRSWNSWAFNYAAEDVYPQTSEVRSGIYANLDASGYGDKIYRITHGMLTTDKGLAAYFVSFSGTFGSYVVPFRDTTFNGNQNQIYDASSSVGSGIKCLAFHAPDGAKVDGGNDYGSRNLFLFEYGMPLQQTNRGATGYTVCEIMSAERQITGKLVAGCDFNYTSYRGMGAVVNFGNIIPSAVISAGKGFVQNDSADFATYTAVTPQPRGETNFTGQSQVSFHAKAFTSEFSPAPPMTVEKVVSNGLVSLALVSGKVNTLWRLTESDEGGEALTWSDDIVNIFCEGNGSLSTFFVLTTKEIYWSSDTITWSSQTWENIAGLPVEITKNDANEVEMSHFDYGFGNYAFMLVFGDIIINSLASQFSLFTKDLINWYSITDNTAFGTYSPNEVTYCSFGNTEDGFVVMAQNGKLAKCLDDDGSDGIEVGVSNVDVVDFTQWGTGITAGKLASAIQFSTNLNTLIVGTTTGQIFHTEDGTTFTQPTLTVDGVVAANLGGSIQKLSGKKYIMAKVLTTTGEVKFFATSNGYDWISFRLPTDSSNGFGNITHNGGNSYHVGELSLNNPTGRLPVFYKVTL